MKKLLMLNPACCGSGDTKKFGIYNVLSDKLVVYNKESDDCEEIPYSEAKKEKYPDAERYVEIEDESSVDSFVVLDENCVVCEDDNKLAHALIDCIDGLGKAVSNMAMLMAKRD